MHAQRVCWRLFTRWPWSEFSLLRRNGASSNFATTAPASTWSRRMAIAWSAADRLRRRTERIAHIVGMIEPAGFDRSDRMFGHAPPSRPAVHPRANSSRSAARFRKTRSILRMRNASDVLDSELEAGAREVGPPSRPCTTLRGSRLGLGEERQGRGAGHIQRALTLDGTGAIPAHERRRPSIGRRAAPTKRTHRRSRDHRRRSRTSRMRSKVRASKWRST